MQIVYIQDKDIQVYVYVEVIDFDFGLRSISNNFYFIFFCYEFIILDVMLKIYVGIRIKKFNIDKMCCILEEYIIRKK